MIEATIKVRWKVDPKSSAYPEAVTEADAAAWEAYFYEQGAFGPTDILEFAESAEDIDVTFAVAPEGR